jgi:hypothetical protein
LVLRKGYELVLLLVILLMITPNVNADSTKNQKSKPNYKWFVSVYGGLFVDETLIDIFSFQAEYSNDNYVIVGALAREFYKYKDWVSFELEGQIGRTFDNEADNWEFVGLVLARWHQFPWDNYIDTSLAFGSGLSYFNEPSQIELEEDEDAQRLLGYLAFELTFGLPQYPRWNLMFRIHHRSGGYGLIGDGESGSNYLCTGLKFAF